MTTPNQIAREAWTKIMRYYSIQIADGTGIEHIQAAIEEAHPALVDTLKQVQHECESYASLANNFKKQLESRAAAAGECILGESCPMFKPAATDQERTRRVNQIGVMPRSEQANEIEAKVRTAPDIITGEPIEFVQEAATEQGADTKRLELLELAWGIIANAGGGDWERENKEWQKAAAKWRDDYFAAMRREETKP